MGLHGFRALPLAGADLRAWFSEAAFANAGLICLYFAYAGANSTSLYD